MKRQYVNTPAAPRPAGAYSQGVIAGGIIAVSGQVGLDPETGDIAEGFPEQVRQTLRNVDAILHSAGSSLQLVVFMTCYLQRIEDFRRFDQMYAEILQEPRPARATIGAVLPPGVLVEIAALAVLDA